MSSKHKKAIGFAVAAAALTPGLALAQPAAPAQGVEEIVVTAERRSVNMQKVPVAVTAITSDVATAAGVTNIADVQVMAPAVNFGSGIGGANISIRGISGTGAIGDESANAVYIDGIYNPIGASLLFGLNNIESIEIDKGPQGTLFGRNASGGAIQIRTRDPQQKPMADVSFGYGNYNTYTATGYVTGGFSEKFAADLALTYMDQNDGWGTNITTGNKAYTGHAYGFRSKLKWTPDELTSVVVAVSYADLQPIELNGTGQTKAGENRVYAGFYNGTNNYDGFQYSKQKNVGVTAKRDLGFATLTNIFDWDFVNQPFSHDLDFYFTPIVKYLPTSKTYGRTWTDELQLQSKADSKISWTVGLYYMDSTNSRNVNLGVGPASAPGHIFTIAPSKSYSGYGQMTVPVIHDTTRLTLGGRYTIDEREFFGTQSGPNPPIPAFTTAPDEHRRDERFTWRFSVDHDLTENTLIYLSATKGFKSGFYNVNAPINVAVSPQDVIAYEIGFKSRLLDNRLRLNASVFHYDFKNIQTRLNQALGPLYGNARAGRIDGIDIDLEARPVPALTLQGGLTVLNSAFNDFNNAQFFSINPAGGIVAFTSASQCPQGGTQTGASTALCNANGYDLVRAPHLSASFGGQYRWQFDRVGNITLAANVYYSDGFYFDVQNRVAQPEYTVLNASLTWEPMENLSVMFWAKNIGNVERFAEVAINGSFGDTYEPEAPVTYGFTVHKRFE